MAAIHYVNGQFLSETEALISALDLGLLRGYGAFDYVQAYNGKPFHLTDHLNRLKWSLDQIQLALPLDVESIQELTYELLARNEALDGGIRFVVTAGISQDQFLPIGQPSFIMLFLPYTPIPAEYYTRGMRVITTRMLRMLPSVKTTNYMPAVFAMKKAKAAGFDDALYLNDRQEILEGTTCNVFFIKEGTIMIPNSDDVVKGVTRSILINITSEHYSLEYCPIYLEDVESFDEAFLCSSVKDVIPLVQIEDKTIGNGMPGPITGHLRKLYREYIDSYTHHSEVSLEYHK